MNEATDKDWAALVATMVARIESEGVGSPTSEKAITDALNAIDGVQEVSHREWSYPRHLRSAGDDREEDRRVDPCERKQRDLSGDR